MNRQLLLATNNVKKLAELRRMLAEQGLAVLAGYRHQPMFYSYDLDRYVLVSSHEQR